MDQAAQAVPAKAVSRNNQNLFQFMSCTLERRNAISQEVQWSDKCYFQVTEANPTVAGAVAERGKRELLGIY